ncbi:MAG: cell division topological specificity factor MinE [Chloroflexi bacterium]|nr:cell division topological specificity factor MinE [Chloroflexota bacterium]
MTNLLSRLFGRAKKGSGATAKDRLRFVLQHDRINLPPERMEEMKSEILAVIVKYLVVDKDRVEIDLEQRDRRHSKLVAEIPVAIHTPPSNSKQITDSSALADVAESNGANNGSDAQSAEDEAAKPEAPKDAVEAKADEGEDEEDKKA